jgi:hypothetical protein
MVSFTRRGKVIIEAWRRTTTGVGEKRARRQGPGQWGSPSIGRPPYLGLVPHLGSLVIKDGLEQIVVDDLRQQRRRQGGAGDALGRGARLDHVED